VAATPPIVIRALDGSDDADIALVARRMRETLVEVLGATRGEAMYDLAWLEQRVRWHLDPTEVAGAVFVADDASGQLLGHTIVRVEAEDDGDVGLFSTTYVDPGHRNRAVAERLLDVGESWMRTYGMTVASTYTDPHNTKLITLFRKRGYRPEPVNDEFVRLSRELEPARTP
jgi:GNAT superfamily N-acetyltransferase